MFQSLQCSASFLEYAKRYCEGDIGLANSTQIIEEKFLTQQQSKPSLPFLRFLFSLKHDKTLSRQTNPAL